MDGVPSIKMLEFFLDDGTVLCSLNYVDKKQKMTMRRTNKINDVMTWDRGTATALNTPIVFEGLMCNNSVVNGNLFKRPDNSNPRNYILEPCYLNVGGAGTETPVINCRLDFDKLKRTVFAVNKDLYCGDKTVNLKITWAPPNTMFWDATTVADPETGAADPAGTFTITNLAIYLALQIDPKIQAELRNQYDSSGLTYLIPSTTVYRQQLTNNTSHSLNLLNVNKTIGSKLKRIYWSAFNSQEKWNTTYDNSNLQGGAAKFTNFNIEINGNALWEGNGFNTATFDNYNYFKGKLRGSCILGVDDYYYNHCVEIDFTDRLPVYKEMAIPENDTVDGLDLIENNWNIVINANGTPANAALVHYVFIETMRVLNISKNNPSILV